MVVNTTLPMAFPSILSKFSQEKKELPEPFLALEISSHYLKSAVWQVKGEKIQLISFGGVEKWDGQDLDELVVQSDSSIAKAVELQELEPNKVLFGLPETWVDQEKIVAPRLRELRQLSHKLDLKPLGFVVTTEAVVSYLKILEGIPLNAILVRLLEDETTISLVKAGKLLGTQVVGRSQNLGEDVYEGILRFSQKEDFPPRILVFNADSPLETEEQSLVSFDWGDLFLHFPRVEVLDEEFSIKAIAIAGGWEVAKAKGQVTQSLPAIAKEAKALVQDVGEEVEEEKAEDLGFVREKDIQEIQTTPPAPPPAVAKEEITFPQKTGESPKKRRFPSLRLPLPHFNGLLSSLIKIPQKIMAKIFPEKNFYLVIIVSLLFLLFLAGGSLAFYWYVPTAKVSLFVRPKNYSKEIKIALDLNISDINYEEFVIPGEKVQASISQSQEIKTTGEKIVGDKASGEITLYNKTNKSQSFSQGTILLGPGDLSFLTDEETEIASASSQEKEGGVVITYGKKKVKIIAEDIGPDYNFSANTEFTLKDYSSEAYSAKNEEALSGGTSRKIKVVSKEDQERLLKELSETLKKEAAEELRKKISGDYKFFEEGIKLETVNKKFNQEVDDESETLQLNLAIKAETLTYSEKDLRELLLAQIKSSLPQGYELRESETKIGIKESEFEDDKISFKGTVEAKLIPQLDEEKIKEEIKGKYREVTKEYFENLPSYQKVDIEISPAFLPAKLKNFPHRVENITIEVEIME